MFMIVILLRPIPMFVSLK